MTPVKSPLVIYIVGKGHSGSTMLELLLNRSHNVAAMGELGMLPLQIYRDERTRWVGRCSCDRRPQDCEFWGPVIRRIHEEHGVDIVKMPFKWRISDTGLEEEFGFAKPFSWATQKFHRCLRGWAYCNGWKVFGLFNTVYKTWISRRDWIIQEYARRRGVEAVVDASKDYLQMVDLWRFSKLPLKILFLTRDVRGLAWSSIRNNRATAFQEAKTWARLNRRIIKTLGRLPKEIWMHVSYEEICRNPEVMLEKIHRFTDIERILVPHEEERNRRHTLAGNQVRQRDLDKIREDLSWKEKLNPREISDIQKVTKEVATSLGYVF